MSIFSKYFKPSFIPAAGWLVVSTVLLCLPGSALPDEPWFHVIWFDKWVHLFMFGLMVLLWSYAFTSRFSEPHRLRIIFFMITLTAIAYGIAMEFIQDKFIPFRTFDPNDMMADATGSFIGLLIMMVFLKTNRRKTGH
jgi:VanZ family protein